MALPDVAITDVANGVLFVIVGLLSWLGINRGMKAKSEDAAKSATPVPSSPYNLQVAGALIDGRKADMLISAIDKGIEVLDRQIKGQDELCDAIRELRTDIRELSREVGRGRR